LQQLVFVYSNFISPTDAVAKQLTRFSGPGIIMVPVRDGDGCPISKQATNDCIDKKVMCRITALCLRNQIRSLRDGVANEPGADKVSLSNQIVTLSRKLKADETQATQSIPRNFVQELDHEHRQIHAYSVDSESAGGYVEEVVVSEFQADAYMAGQIINGAAVMAMTRYSDIPIVAIVVLASNPLRSATMRSFRHPKTLRQAMKFVAGDSKAQFPPSAIPLFEGVGNPRLRAFLMLILGCDVYGPGTIGVGE
jgi:hypothetical protein